MAKIRFFNTKEFDKIKPVTLLVTGFITGEPRISKGELLYFDETFGMVLYF